MTRAKLKPNPYPERCETHAPQRGWDMCGSSIDAEERIERGERQERCAKCLRWLWPDQRGHGFVGTGESDRD